MALWDGRFSKDTDSRVAAFSASVHYDKRLYQYDIDGSLAHVAMLAKIGVISDNERDTISAELEAIRQRIADDAFNFNAALEDVHMNIESALIDKLGDTGAKLHSGRSRNDQIATDERLYVRDVCSQLAEELRSLQTALVESAERNSELVLPGFTHLQHAQPVLLAHHLLAYVEMFDRDSSRLADCAKRANVLPLGSGALAGSTLPLDREFVAKKLGFDSVSRNSMDAVADRDHLLELLATLSILVIHTSRLSEDLILWSSQQFAFVELDDAFCTGSSLMPQKKNPDVAELTRGKTGRVIGALMALLTTMKGLPLTYNRDMQEDKEELFDAVDTVRSILGVLAPMMATAVYDVAAMRQAASDPALMATDLAEWLVLKGVPFRDAHHQVGRLVAFCRDNDLELNEVSIDDMRAMIPKADTECLNLFDPDRSVAARNITGGTAPAQVTRQLEFWKKNVQHRPRPS